MGLNVNTPHTCLLLASASPRRAALMRQLDLKFDIAAADIDESVLPEEQVADYVMRLATEKARAVIASYQIPLHVQELIVIASDTAVSIDNAILGKPRDYQHAREMWLKLSGTSHQVLSSLAVMQLKIAGSASESNAKPARYELISSKSALSTSTVEFCPLTEANMMNYWATGEPQDKAGAYAVQGIAAQWIRKISGSYSGIMGLPLYELSCLLTECGVELK